MSILDPIATINNVGHAIQLALAPVFLLTGIAGKLGAAVARLFGEDPSVQISEDLQRFKHLMETGKSLKID